MRVFTKEFNLTPSPYADSFILIGEPTEMVRRAVARDGRRPAVAGPIPANTNAPARIMLGHLAVLLILGVRNYTEILTSIVKRIMIDVINVHSIRWGHYQAVHQYLWRLSIAFSISRACKVPCPAADNIFMAGAYLGAKSTGERNEEIIPFGYKTTTYSRRGVVTTLKLACTGVRTEFKSLCSRRNALKRASAALASFANQCSMRHTQRLTLTGAIQF